LRVVNLGGDADIHGALYGQLAGAVAGIDGIPKAWRSALVAHERLERTADRLLAAALAPRE
jgi:ADP-ribosylglycohydrolase